MVLPLDSNDCAAIDSPLAKKSDGGVNFFGLLQRYRFKLFLAFVCIILSNLSALVFPWSVKVLLDEVFIHHQYALLGQILWLLVVATALKALFAYLGSYLGMQVGEKAVADLREKLYRHLLRLSVVTVENFSTGELISRVAGDTESVKRFLFSGILDFFYSALSAIFVIGALFFMDVKLALFSAVTLPLFLVFYGKISGKLKRDYASMRQRHAELSGRLGETFRGVRAIHVFDRSEHEAHKFCAKQREILNISFKTYSIETLFLVTAEFLSSLGLAALLGYGAWQIKHDKMTIGMLMAFYTYFGFLFLPLLKIAASGGVYRQARASLERIQQLLEYAPEPKETDDPFTIKKIEGQVWFQNVSFAYPDSRAVLCGIDFEARPGEWVAFVGLSGSGKTTLACLLSRIFDPVSGGIFVDGNNIRNFSLKDYRQQVAVVFQNDFLFSDTIAANIRYGNLEANDEAVLTAAKAADIHSFVTGLPDRYDSFIGEGGVKLSSGQRQRLAIARALLKDPAVLVLDEAISSIDPASASQIMENIRRLRKGRTTFVITHRLSTVRNADKILVMRNGKIEDSGRHEDLFVRNTLYRSLCRRPSGLDDLLEQEMHVV